MGFLSTLLFNPITIVGAVYFVASESARRCARGAAAG